MSQQEFDTYLSLLCRLLRIAPQQREQVAEEFRAHMEDRLDELLARGMDREGAVKVALEEFGDAAGLAAQIASISQGRRKRWIMRISVASVLCVALAGLLCLALLPEHQQVPVIAKAQAQQNRDKPDSATADTPETRIEKALSKSIDLSVRDKPLKEVIASIEEMAKVPVLIDVKKLEEAAINMETQVTFNIKGISLRSALRLMLRPYGITYIVEDEVMQITTTVDAGSRLHIRVYDCRELRNLPDTKTSTSIKETGSAPPAVGKVASPPATMKTRRRDVPDDLVAVLTTTVTPETWEDVGGPGGVEEYNGLLVVSQTNENHEKVEKLLNVMYSASGLEGKVKVSR